MKNTLVILFAVCLLVACNENARTGAVDTSHQPVNPVFDSILAGLSNNYVLNVNYTGDSRKSILEFYNKTEDEVANDSVRYHKAVISFFASDSLMLNYLLKFKGNKDQCKWVYNHNPFSASRKSWEAEFTKEMGAVVLIYDFLNYIPEVSTIKISARPELIEKINSRLSMSELEDWINKNKGPLSEMRQKFNVEFKSIRILAND